MNCIAANCRFGKIWFKSLFLRFLLGVLPFLFFKDGAKLIHKGIDILKFPVNRGKANIRYLVQPSQLFHRQLPDPAGIDLAFQRVFELLLDLIDDLIEAFERNRTFLTTIKGVVSTIS